MHQQQRRTIQQTSTTMPPAEVLAEAKRFFARRNGIYAAFLEKEGPTFVAMRGQGGEEVLIGTRPVDGATEVTGSSYLFDQQIARFLATLPPYVAPVADAVAGVVGDGTNVDTVTLP
jgi:hypothetical protein